MLSSTGFPVGFRSALPRPNSSPHTSKYRQLCFCASTSILCRLVGQVDTQESNVGLLMVGERHGKSKEQNGSSDLDMFAEICVQKGSLLFIKHLLNTFLKFCDTTGTFS